MVEMRRALVVNCTKGRYNLAAYKMLAWLPGQGYQVTFADGDPGPLFSYAYDLVALSAIFSWDAPTARNIALRVKGNSDVWAGGPGLAALSRWWMQETGLPCQAGIDPRFDRQPGAYHMTFASRGCPEGCWFCIVPKVEGRQFTLHWDFTPAPILLDNNLSALPVDFQKHIVSTYQAAGMKLQAWSGFSPHYFDEACYQRWKPVLQPPWRLAFDEMQEADAVERAMRVLSGVRPRMTRVYVLVGNEPLASCYERVRKVIEWGGEPYVQRYRPLNYLGGPLPVRHDWTEAMLVDFSRYFNRYLWRRGVRLQEYTNRKNSRPLFADLAGTVSVDDGLRL